MPLPTLTEIVPALWVFAPVFSAQVWPQALTLLVGAILAPDERTVAATLRVMGLGDDPHVGNYHRVLSRAMWSGLQASRILLGLLVLLFLSADSPLPLVIDETLERRQGAQIRAKGVFRDAVRSSKTHVVTSFGLRWIALALVVKVPWAKRPWALPFLPVLAPAARANEKCQRRHKTVVRWAQQMIALVRRWQPKRRLILIGDGAYAAVCLALTCARLPHPVALVSRLRFDAGLYAPPPAPVPGRRGPKPKKGARLPVLRAQLAATWQTAGVPWYGGQTCDVQWQTGTARWYTPGFDPVAIRWVVVHSPTGEFQDQAFFCPDQTAPAPPIIAWFVLRWNLEVTFEDARAQLGIETQRQWSDQAIARTTPCLWGLYALITALTQQWTAAQPLPIRVTAWYHKEEATFADAIAFVRRTLWLKLNCVDSAQTGDSVLIPRAAFERLLETLCYAA